MTDRETSSGSAPALYHEHLGPVMFEPFAENLVQRLPHRDGLRVLELACGTGIVTRRLRAHLPSTATLVAVDISPTMLAYARLATATDGIVWELADAQALPFADGSFDVVACQFGLMFVPDKVQCFREAHRALSPGGTLIASLWRSPDENSHVRILESVLARLFPDEPPRFVTDVPFGYSDERRVRADMHDGGWAEIRFEIVRVQSEAESAERFARGLVRGGRLRIWLDERGADLSRVERELAAAFAASAGARPMRVSLAATVVTAIRHR